jgi:hypothetical protein
MIPPRQLRLLTAISCQQTTGSRPGQNTWPQLTVLQTPSARQNLQGIPKRSGFGRDFDAARRPQLQSSPAAESVIAREKNFISCKGTHPGRINERFGTVTTLPLMILLHL